MQAAWEWAKWLGGWVPALIERAPVATAYAWPASILIVIYMMWG